MNDRKVAFSPVVLDRGFGVAIVEQDVAGFVVDPSEAVHETWDAANKRAAFKNEHDLKLAPMDTWNVIDSSIGASRKANITWGPRSL